MTLTQNNHLSSNQPTEIYNIDYLINNIDTNKQNGGTMPTILIRRQAEPISVVNPLLHRMNDDGIIMSCTV